MGFIGFRVMSKSFLYMLLRLLLRQVVKIRGQFKEGGIRVASVVSVFKV